MSLNNLANRRSELGQRRPALLAAQEAVDLYRELSTLRPEAFSEIAARERALFGRPLTVEIPYPGAPAVGEGAAR